MAWSKDPEKRKNQENAIRICENCGTTFKLGTYDQIVCDRCMEEAMSNSNDPWLKNK